MGGEDADVGCWSGLLVEDWVGSGWERRRKEIKVGVGDEFIL